jgi:hypothetical protein
MMHSRRTTLQWMMAAAALPVARLAPPAMAAGNGSAKPFETVVDWPSQLPAPPVAQGYGRDPDLIDPQVPWPLTLTQAQRATVDMLGDMILPADDVSPGAGQLGVGGFIDEWISAPYPAQRADRAKVVGGLIWLDAQSRAMHGKAFTALSMAQRGALLDAMTVAAPVDKMAQPVAFMDRLRHLFVVGFYSLPEGKADMGYVGDQPTAGPYPGPTPEALQHFRGVLAALKLPAETA